MSHEPDPFPNADDEEQGTVRIPRGTGATTVGTTGRDDAPIAEEQPSYIRAGIGSVEMEHTHQWVASSRFKVIGGKVFKVDVCVARYGRDWGQGGDGAGDGEGDGGGGGGCMAKRARRVTGQALSPGQQTGHLPRPIAP